MGCDIHPIIEYRERDDDWDIVAIPDHTRNYEFFSLVAGVRGEHEAWVEPRGLPKKDYAYDYETYVDGDHTPSWFTLEEAERFQLPEDVRDYTRLQWHRWLETMRFVAKLYKRLPCDVRAVFNFDS